MAESGSILAGELNTKAAQTALHRFATETDRPIAEVLRIVAKGAARELAALTPPVAPGFNPRASWAEQRRAGVKAVDDDIRGLFLQVEALKILQNPQRPEVAEKLQDVLKTDRAKAASALYHLGAITGEADLIDEPTAELHNAARDGRGRVRSRQRRYVVRRKGAVSKFIKAKQRRVGLLMSGWTRSARGLGLKLPQWVTRQGGEGSFVEKTGPFVRDPYIRMSNRVSYLSSHSPGRIERIVARNALAKINRQLEAKMRGAWKKIDRRAG